MIVLVANLGSTSFKYKLFDLDAQSQQVLARGDADRIGQGDSRWSITALQGESSGTRDLADHGQAIDLHLQQLGKLGVEQASHLQAIGFKAVHGGPISGAVRVDDEVLSVMERFADLAPAHNPPYIAAMRSFKEKLPGVPQVAAFETAFHQSIPLARQVYGTPHEWIDMGVRRYGFHGASNAYIARRMKQIDPDSRRIINLHLGGSSSVCAIRDGKSCANSFGTTAQSGLFHASRVGDFDAFAMLMLQKHGLSQQDIFKKLASGGGLAGLSGVSPDMRLVKQAAEQGNAQAKLAIDAFVESARHYLGAYLVVLGGVDAITFTGGIGQHDWSMRRQVLDGLDFLGLKLEQKKNETAPATGETCISAGDSNVKVWVLPTDEELVVARQTFEVLHNN